MGAEDGAFCCGMFSRGMVPRMQCEEEHAIPAGAGYTFGDAAERGETLAVMEEAVG